MPSLGLERKKHWREMKNVAHRKHKLNGCPLGTSTIRTNPYHAMNSLLTFDRLLLSCSSNNDLAFAQKKAWQLSSNVSDMAVRDTISFIFRFSAASIWTVLFFPLLFFWKMNIIHRRNQQLPTSLRTVYSKIEVCYVCECHKQNHPNEINCK